MGRKRFEGEPALEDDGEVEGIGSGLLPLHSTPSLFQRKDCSLKYAERDHASKYIDFTIFGGGDRREVCPSTGKGTTRADGVNSVSQGLDNKEQGTTEKR